MFFCCSFNEELLEGFVQGKNIFYMDHLAWCLDNGVEGAEVEEETPGGHSSCVRNGGSTWGRMVVRELEKSP